MNIPKALEIKLGNIREMPTQNDAQNNVFGSLVVMAPPGAAVFLFDVLMYVTYVGSIRFSLYFWTKACMYAKYPVLHGKHI